MSNKQGINVLSLFDGISCGQIALERAGIKVNNYYASEIDKYAIQITQKNYPNTIQVGNVTELDVNNLPKIDLLIGGSPCQGFSYAGKGLNFNDERSKLFFEFVRILNIVKPKYFLLENVKMKKEWKDIISNTIKVNPILIDSSLITAGKRERLYWTNIPNVSMPTPKNIFLRDIIEPVVDDKYYLSDKRVDLIFNGKKFGLTNKICDLNGKSFTLTASMGLGGGYEPKIKVGNKYRKLTPLECERLQTLPENYTNCVSNTHRYKGIGNGWTVDVISHIFSFIPKHF